MYVIVRDDGKFVTPPGSAHSYTGKLQEAQVYTTKGEAERNACVDNERVIPLIEATTATMRGGRA